MEGRKVEATAKNPEQLINEGERKIQELKSKQEDNYRNLLKTGQQNSEAGLLDATKNLPPLSLRELESRLRPFDAMISYLEILRNLNLKADSSQISWITEEITKLAYRYRISLNLALFALKYKKFLDFRLENDMYKELKRISQQIASLYKFETAEESLLPETSKVKDQIFFNLMSQICTLLKVKKDKILNITEEDLENKNYIFLCYDIASSTTIPQDFVEEVTAKVFSLLDNEDLQFSLENTGDGANIVFPIDQDIQKVAKMAQVIVTCFGLHGIVATPIIACPENLFLGYSQILPKDLVTTNQDLSLAINDNKQVTVTAGLQRLEFQQKQKICLSRLKTYLLDGFYSVPEIFEKMQSLLKPSFRAEILTLEGNNWRFMSLIISLSVISKKLRLELQGDLVRYIQDKIGAVGKERVKMICGTTNRREEIPFNPAELPRILGDNLVLIMPFKEPQVYLDIYNLLKKYNIGISLQDLILSSYVGSSIPAVINQEGGVIFPNGGLTMASLHPKFQDPDKVPSYIFYAIELLKKHPVLPFSTQKNLSVKAAKHWKVCRNQIKSVVASLIENLLLNKLLETDSNNSSHQDIEKIVKEAIKELKKVESSSVNSDLIDAVVESLRTYTDQNLSVLILLEIKKNYPLLYKKLVKPTP